MKRWLRLRKVGNCKADRDSNEVVVVVAVVVVVVVLAAV